MSGDQTHRFSQPPSKVLHIRNLPYETTHEELVELAQPFGRLVQSKLNVGPNRNQAFIEFPDQTSAVTMCNYFNGSADPAKVRGKTVYLQYSNRQEIINAKNTADTPSNVLLVSLENLLPEVPITLEILHLVFSAFGMVYKIATFEKQAGLQALVQFGDVATAERVRQDLDGKYIPKHLLGDTPYPPLLKITFSQHTDLNVRVQSHRSRDYTATGGALPVSNNPNDPLLNLQAPINIADPTESNVLLAQIENMAYPVTVDALHTVFSPYGYVQKIAIFEKNGQHQALIQYPDGMSATQAMQALEGHAIYDGGYNKLKITYSRHKDLNVKGNNDKSADYTGGILGTPGQTIATGASAPTSAVIPASAYQGPGSDLLMGGFGGAVSMTEVSPSGTDYETAHTNIAKGAETALGGSQGGPPAQQYSRPAGGQQFGGPPGQPPAGYSQAPPQYAPPQSYGGPQGPPPGSYGQSSGQFNGPGQGYAPPPGQYGQPVRPPYHQGPPGGGYPPRQPYGGGRPYPGRY